MLFFLKQNRLVKNSTFLVLTPKQLNSRTGLKCKSQNVPFSHRIERKSSFTKKEISIKSHGAIIWVFGSKLDLGVTRVWVENTLLKKNSSSRNVAGVWDLAVGACVGRTPQSFRHASFDKLLTSNAGFESCCRRR